MSANAVSSAWWGALGAGNPNCKHKGPELLPSSQARTLSGSNFDIGPGRGDPNPHTQNAKAPNPFSVEMDITI